MELTISYASLRKLSIFLSDNAGSVVGRASWLLRSSLSIGVRSVIIVSGLQPRALLLSSDKYSFSGRRASGRSRRGLVRVKMGQQFKLIVVAKSGCCCCPVLFLGLIPLGWHWHWVRPLKLL